MPGSRVNPVPRRHSSTPTCELSAPTPTLPRRWCSLCRAAWTAPGRRNIRGSGRNAVRNLVHIDELEEADVEWFAGRDDFEITPEHYADAGIPPRLAVDADLMTLLGFYVAEGSCSDRNGIRLSIGNGNVAFAPEIAERMTRVFGLAPTLYDSRRSGRRAEAGQPGRGRRVAKPVWIPRCGIPHEAHPGPRLQRARSAAPRVPARVLPR